MSLYGRDSNILAFDPSTTSTGWAHMTSDVERILSYGRIRPSSKHDIKQRTLEIGQQSSELIRMLKPSIVLIEEPDDQGIVGRTTGTQAKLAACSYLIAGRAIEGGFRVELIPVQQWKGSVPKDVIYRRLLEIYGGGLPRGGGSKPWNHDAIDAIGIARYWVRHQA